VNNGLKDAAGKPLPLGWVDGHAAQVLNQVIGSAIAWGLAIVGTLVILKICDVVVGLRVSAEQETAGLDLSMHGEEGYILES
jgi:ammonium transporter, Amt family